MAESRANRINEGGIWRYLDQNDAEFVLMSMFDYPVEVVDDFIDGLQGSTLPEETIDLLREIRHDALQAYIAKNIPLMEAKLQGLHMACRVAGMLPAAKLGSKFKKGRKQGSSGPIRKAIARLLKKTPAMKNAELWRAIKDNPPRGWKVYENRAGHYIEGPEAGDNMGYERFCNVSAEERKKLNQKITG